MLNVITETKYWCLWVWEQNSDWLIGNYPTLLDKIDKVEKKDNVYVEHNQDAYWFGSDMCTLTWPLICLDSYINEKRKRSDVEDLRDYATKYWNPKYQVGVGNWTQNWANTVVSRWNKNYPSNRFAYFAVDAISKEMAKAREKNLWVSLTYRWNAKYNIDVMMDWKLDWVDFGDPTYWHTHWYFFEKTNIIWVNSYYKQRKHNIYKIPIWNLKKLVENNVYYQRWYIYIAEKELKKHLWLTIEEIAVLEKSKQYAKKIHTITHWNQKLYEIEKRATEIAQHARTILAKNKIKTKNQ